MTASPDPVAPPRREGHARPILALALPLIGGHLAQFAVGLTDTVMIGWYGVEELAALTLAHSYFFTIFIMGSGFAWAVMPMVAAAAGTADDTQVRRVTRMGLWISILFGLAALPLLVWSGPILRLFGQEPGVAADAELYLRLVGIGLIPGLLMMVLKSYLAALGRTQVVFWVMAGTAVVNALLNYAFIFGNWGAPELGIQGAALASIGVQIAGLAALVLYARAVTPEYLLFQRFWRPDREAFARVFRLGWPIGLTNLAEVGLFTASAFMMGWIGTIELAAHGIAITLASATFMFHLGLSNAATIRAGRAYGRRDERALRDGAAAIIAISLALALLTVAVFLAVPEPLVRLFLDPADPAGPEIVVMGTALLSLAALFQLADGAQVMALGLLRGVQDTRVPMIYAGLSYWAIGIPASYVLGFPVGWGAAGIWAGLVLGLLFAGVLLMGRFWMRSVRIG
jgi:MATE family multidrug resistance protein